MYSRDGDIGALCHKDKDKGILRISIIPYDIWIFKYCTFTNSRAKLKLKTFGFLSFVPHVIYYLIKCMIQDLKKNINM